MKKHSLGSALPPDIVPPLRFREKERQVEGEVRHPSEIVKMFEPIDVLDGATELVDQRGVLITIESDDPDVVGRNEYPRSLEGIHYTIHS